MRMVTPILLFLLTACATSSEPDDAAPAALAVVRNPRFPLPPAATYELVAGTLELPDDPKFDAQQINGMVRAALMVGLDRRGYRPAQSGTAQLRVGYAVVHGDVLDDSQLTRIFGVSPGWRAPAGESYAKGTIIVLVTDGSGRHAIWQGAVQGQVHRELSDKARRERIGRAVERLLDRLR